jgi:hypothetical protein
MGLTARAQTSAVDQFDGVEIAVSRVDDGNLATFPEMATALAVQHQWWRGGVHTDIGPPRPLTIPLMPLPALRVTIRNNSDRALSFRGATFVSDGGSWTVLTTHRETVPRAIDRLLSADPQMWELRERLGPYESWPRLLRDGRMAPVLQVRAAAERVPLVSSTLEVLPNTVWEGAMSIVPSDDKPPTSGLVTLRWHGLQLGDTPVEDRVFSVDVAVPRRQFVRCGDGHIATSPRGCEEVTGYQQWHRDGPCLQQGPWVVDGRRLLSDAVWLRGERITMTDRDTLLRRDPVAGRLAKKAQAMRISSYVLIAAGVAAGVATAVAVGLSGDREHAPAGLAFLGISAVGGGLGFAAYNTQLEAIRTYNERAFQTGNCFGGVR